jgi:hypothetical protein
VTDRFEIVPIVGTGAEDDPYRAGLPDGSAWVHLGRLGDRALVKHVVADGTPQTPGTIADVDADGEIDTKPLTAPQQAGARALLAARGVDMADWDATPPATRLELLTYVLTHALGWDVAEMPRQLTYYSVAGGA